MGKFRENPRYEVVSMRVTSEEKEAIKQFSRRAKMSTSDALRDAVQQAGLFNNRRKHAATAE